MSSLFTSSDGLIPSAGKTLPGEPRNRDEFMGMPPALRSGIKGPAFPNKRLHGQNRVVAQVWEISWKSMGLICTELNLFQNLKKKKAFLKQENRKLLPPDKR